MGGYWKQALGTGGVLKQKDSKASMWEDEERVGRRNVKDSPGITHHKPSILAGFLAPAVLHAPPHRLARLVVDVHRSEHHGVRHGALARAQARGLVHAQQADVEAELVVDECDVHDARDAVAELAHVAAEEHGQARAEHSHAGRLERRHIHVDVGDSSAADDVAEAVDGEEREGRVSRVVDERHQARHGGRGKSQLGRPDVGGEGEWRGADLSRAARLVGELPCEGLGRGRRWSEGEGEDGVDLLHHASLGSCHGGGGCGRAAEHRAEDESVLTKLGEDDAVDDAGGHGVEGVGVEDLRDWRAGENRMLERGCPEGASALVWIMHSPRPYFVTRL